MPEKKVKILMVCLGNICRSPLAQGILENKLDPTKFQISSAGTANYHIGKQPDSRSIAVARKHGINISNQQAQQFKISDFDTYDHIFVMDTSNYGNVISLARNETDIKKVRLILSLIDAKNTIDVPDPYYGGDSGFDHVYQLLDEACDVIVSQI